jgi:NADPH:quinone reductase-like Zn-dependent oxidoreductase
MTTAGTPPRPAQTPGSQVTLDTGAVTHKGGAHQGRDAEVIALLDYSGTFEDQVRDVDVVIDLVGGTTTARSWPVMRSGGTLVAIAREPDPGRVVGGTQEVEACRPP